MMFSYIIHTSRLLLRNCIIIIYIVILSISADDFYIGGWDRGIGIRFRVRNCQRCVLPFHIGIPVRFGLSTAISEKYTHIFD